MSGYSQAVPPPGGLFGNPEFFIIESRDRDSEERNFGPLLFETAGVLPLKTAGLLVSVHCKYSYLRPQVRSR
jgi:hypothetical protein